MRLATGVRSIVESLLSPFTTTYNPIKALLNAPTEKNANQEDRDTLTGRWRKAKIDELAYLALTSALLAGLFATAFTWPAAANCDWSISACWYSGLMLIIASIATATQQSIALHRFSSSAGDMERIRRLLGYKGAHNKSYPRLMQIFIWQIPVMMLRFGIYFFFVGLFLLLWEAAYENGHRIPPNFKTALMFSIVAGISFVCHAVSAIFCYYGSSCHDNVSTV